MLYRVDEAARALGISRSKLYQLKREKRIEIGKLAGRSVVKSEELLAFIQREYGVDGGSLISTRSGPQN